MWQQKFVALLCKGKTRHVDMSGLQLLKVPKCFSFNSDCSTFVHVLDLSNNSLKKIPSALSRLVQLRKLYLANNFIPGLPDEFFKLKKVYPLLNLLYFLFFSLLFFLFRLFHSSFLHSLLSAFSLSFLFFFLPLFISIPTSFLLLFLFLLFLLFVFFFFSSFFSFVFSFHG